MIDTVVGHMAAHIVRGLLKLCRGISHGNAAAYCLQHLQVIIAVAEGQSLRPVQMEMGEDLLHADSLAAAGRLAVRLKDNSDSCRYPNYLHGCPVWQRQT